MHIDVHILEMNIFLIPQKEHTSIHLCIFHLGGLTNCRNKRINKILALLAFQCKYKYC